MRVSLAYARVCANICISEHCTRVFVHVCVHVYVYYVYLTPQSPSAGLPHRAPAELIVASSDVPGEVP